MTVVIVSFNTRELTLECLSALMRDLSGASSGIAAEVWVVDNGSVDGSAPAIAAAFPTVTVVEARRNLGFSAANNEAIRRAAGEFVLLLNSDAFVRPGTTAALVARLRAAPDVAVVGPRLLNRDGSLQRSCYRFPSPWRAACEHLLLTAAFPDSASVGDYRNWPHDHDREVDVVIGACCLVRRRAIDEVGGLDEGFFFYGEDLDWCLRFRRGGWRVAFTPAAEVVHVGGASSVAQPDRTFRAFQSAVDRFHRKHYGLAGWVAFRAAQTFGSVVRVALFGCRALVGGTGRGAARDRVQLWYKMLKWSVMVGPPSVTPTGSVGRDEIRSAPPHSAT